jgi:hypothetical protein
VLAGALVLAAVSSVLALRGGDGSWLHPPDTTSQRRAGEWIADHTAPDERIMTRSMVVEMYAERTTVALPYADVDAILRYGRHYGVQYLVIDTGTARRVRPQLAPVYDAERYPGLRLVHEVRSERVTTKVYALDPAPPTGGPAGPALGFVGDT